MKFELDTTTNTLKFGKWSCNPTTNHPLKMSAICLCRELLRVNKLINAAQIQYQKYQNSGMNDVHAEHKAYTDVLGNTPKKLLQVFKKMWYIGFILPIKNKIRHIPQPNLNISNDWYTIIHRSMNIINQLELDGLQKLIPICAYFNKTPQGCRQLLGKGLWKQICALSPTKIGLVVNAILNIFGDYGHETITAAMYVNHDGITDPHHAKLKSSLGAAIKFKYSTLRLMATKSSLHYPIDIFNNHVEFMAWCNKNKINNRREIQNYVNLFTDTHHMAGILGYKFNPNITKETLVVIHDEYRKLTDAYRKGESTIPFKNYESLSNLFATLKSSKYVATAFEHSKQMSDEGRDQHHCLGSYSNIMYYNDDTIFFCIKKHDGVTYSNVQLTKRINDDNVEAWTLTQHYKKYNAPVDCKEATRLVNVVIDELNKLL